MFLFFTLSVQSLWASEKPEGSTSGSEGVGEGPLPDGAVAVIKVSMDDQQKMGESFVKGALFSLKSRVPVLFVPDLPKVDTTVNNYDEDTGLTRLHKECLKDSPSPKEIRTLIEVHRARVDLPTKEPYETPGLKAVHLARQKGHNDLAGYLNALREPNEYDETSGLTLLHQACAHPETKLDEVKYLVEKKGADVSLKTREPAENVGLTASEVALETGLEDVSEYLEAQEEEKAKS